MSRQGSFWTLLARQKQPSEEAPLSVHQRDSLLVPRDGSGKQRRGQFSLESISRRMVFGGAKGQEGSQLSSLPSQNTVPSVGERAALGWRDEDQSWISRDHPFHGRERLSVDKKGSHSLFFFSNNAGELCVIVSSIKKGKGTNTHETTKRHAKLRDTTRPQPAHLQPPSRVRAQQPEELVEG